jgi:hypothetical protein
MQEPPGHARVPTFGSPIVNRTNAPRPKADVRNRVCDGTIVHFEITVALRATSHKTRHSWAYYVALFQHDVQTEPRHETSSNDLGSVARLYETRSTVPCPLTPTADHLRARV